MLSIKTTIVDRIRDIEKAERKSTFKNLGHASASVRKDAVSHFEKSTEVIGFFHHPEKGTVKYFKPSARGKPPLAHRTIMFFRRMIRFDVEKSRSGIETGSVVGPSAGIADDIFQQHEHGERPFMFPALKRQADRIPQQWAGTIGG